MCCILLTCLVAKKSELHKLYFPKPREWNFHSSIKQESSLSSTLWTSIPLLTNSGPLWSQWKSNWMKVIFLVLELCIIHGDMPWKQYFTNSLPCVFFSLMWHIYCTHSNCILLTFKVTFTSRHCFWTCNEIFIRNTISLKELCGKRLEEWKVKHCDLHKT